MTLDLSRRRFLGFLAAPAIVRVASLMPVKAFDASWDGPYGAFSPEAFSTEPLVAIYEYRVDDGPWMAEGMTSTVTPSSLIQCRLRVRVIHDNLPEGASDTGTQGATSGAAC